MIDNMAGECSTSSGATSIEEAAKRAFNLCRTNQVAVTVFEKIDGVVYRVRVSEEPVVEELKVAGRAPCCAG